ncbi:MAG: HPP family protein [Methylococcaceae bacterium]
MRIFSFTTFTQFIPPAGNLTLKDQFIPVIASFFCIAAVTISSNYLSSVFQSILPTLILLSSMGSSVVILLLVPHSPLAQPWSFFAGHLVSAFVGIICALYVTPFWVACALAVSGSIFAMLGLRCLHPPCAGTTLVPVIGGTPFISLGYHFLIPVLCNVLVMLMMVLIVNRWLLKRDYPQSFKVIIPADENSLSKQDVQNALKSGSEFVDVNLNKLHELLLTAEQQKLKRLHGKTTCSEIMTTGISSVEYGTEVETAWQIMYTKKLKAMPVIDKAQRVVGIITRADFFKFVNLSPYDNFQEKLRAFIRRTPYVTTKKPEVIGHIMTKQVVVLSGNTSITDLIILFSAQGHQQIPIINAEKRLIGMVYQSNLITALSQLMQLAVQTKP